MKLDWPFIWTGLNLSYSMKLVKDDIEGEDNWVSKYPS